MLGKSGLYIEIRAKKKTPPGYCEKQDFFLIPNRSASIRPEALQFQDDGNAEREDESVAKVATGIIDPR